MAQNGQNAKPRRFWLVSLTVVLAAVAVVAVMSVRRKEVSVQTARTIRGNISTTISTNGKIQPVDNFESHAPSPTTVRRILVSEGDKVKAGQLLVLLDDADARAQAARARAQLRKAEADQLAMKSGGTADELLTLNSQLAKAQNSVDAATRGADALQRLQEKGAASAGEVAAAEDRLRSAQSDLKLAQDKQTGRFSASEIASVESQISQARAAVAAAEDLMARCEIRAPRNGEVYSLPVRQGQFVNTGELLIQVADLSVVQLIGYVDEPDIGRLHSGEPVQVTWDAIPGRIWEGQLTRVPTTVVKVETRNVGEVRCQVNNGDRKLLPNVNVSLSIITGQAQNVVLAPREAVHEENGRRFVYEVEGDRIRRHNIETGISNLTQVEIIQGIAENMELALGTTDGQPLRDGMTVRIESR
jgi:HlyD family secretion protein